MSGGPADKQAILGEVIPAGILVVTHDALIALAGATGGEPGVITIAGTGSIAFGRNGSGETARAGGWGYLFGDEGGGFDIVRQALRAALRHEEGWGPPTSLHGMLLESSSARDANEALHIFYTLDWPRPRVAALAARVDEAALQGDAVARDILHNAAQNLAALCTSVRSRLWKSGEAARIAYVGGVFRSHMLTERFRMLLELEEGNRCASALHSPAAGALLEAYRSAGLSPNLSNVPEM
jgi:N-acetylglucosamine kinase-like BadF-type ATPase